MKRRLLVVVLAIFLVSGCGKKSTSISSIDGDIVFDLLGNEQIELEYNETYEEPGYTAYDKNGNDITDEVVVEGNVLKNVGEYTLIYHLNVDNQEYTKTRKVRVKPLEVTENAASIPVLMYHYFYDDTALENGANANYLAKSTFVKQLEYLKNNDYYFPTLEELRKYVDGEIKLPQKSIVLTMDDGHESVYRIAYPLAVQYQVPIIWFIVTSWTDPTLPYQTEIQNSGYVRMESHTHNMHRSGCNEGHGGYFLCVSKEDGVKDLATSKELLKNAVSVAYPFGDYNDEAKEIVKEAGYLLAFTTEYGRVKPGMDSYSLPRVRISDGMSLDSFVAAIS